MSRIASFSEWLLRSPFLWGGLAWMLFYALLKQDVIDNDLLDRYVMGHWIEKVTFAVSFIAIAGIVIRGLGLIKQFAVLDRPLLEPISAGGQPTSDAPRLMEQLDEVPTLYQGTYLIQRVRAALEFVARKDSAETLDKQLLHLEELDLDRMSSGYSLTRIILWLVPSLGFLGTVIGIGEAVGHLSFDAEAIIESLKQVIPPLTFAFDTTAVSLALAIPIMFMKFFVEGIESKLLSRVDARTESELVGRFFQFGSANDPQVAAVRRMAEQVVRTVETMSVRQGQILRDTIEESHRHWADITAATGKLLDESLQSSIHDSLERHAQTLTTATDRQVKALEHLLGSQLSAMNTAIENQITLLNEGVKRNVNAIENGVVNRLGLVDDAFTRQVRELEALVSKQIEVLGQAILTQSESLQHNTGDLIGKLRDGLERMAELLVEALHKHGETLTRSEEELAQENRRHLSEVEAALGEAMVLAADRQERLVQQSERLLGGMQTALVDAANNTVEQQQQLIRQGDILLKVVDAAGQIKRLEEVLNQNLSTLGRTHNFEETLLSLSAAIQLLSARMGREGAGRPHVDFDSPHYGNKSSHAA